MNDHYLSDADRAEIERAQAYEPPHKTARRLGLPTRAVKAEVRRLRGEARRAPQTDGPRSRLAWAAAASVAVLGVAGAAYALFARPGNTTATVEPESVAEQERPHVEVTREPVAARDLYAKLDRNEAPDPAEVVRQLSSADVATRMAAARAYTKFPSADRDPTPLLPLLNDPDRRCRLAALSGIGRIRDDRAVPALVALLNAERPLAEHHLALTALGSTPTEQSLEALIDLLAHETPHTRTEAFAHLARMLGDDLGFTQADLQDDFEAVQTAFRKHLDARRRAS